MTVPSINELAKLLVSTLGLEVAPEEIKPGEPLFGQGLGLDSIDGLELGMAIKKNYGVIVEGDNIKKIFASLTSLHEHILKNCYEKNI